MEEIINLTVEDPLVRAVLAGCDLRCLIPKYKEPDLIISTSKVFGSIENAGVHRLWSDAITSFQANEDFVSPPPDRICEALRRTLRYVIRMICMIEFLRRKSSDPMTSFLAARHLSQLNRLWYSVSPEMSVRYGGTFRGQSQKGFYGTLLGLYFEVAEANPHAIEWSTFDFLLKITRDFENVHEFRPFAKILFR